NRVNDYRLNISHCKIEVVENWFFFAIKELLDNAFKFSSVGQQVTVESKSSGDITEISIKDEGGRFPEEIMRQIGLFAQFDRNKTERQGICMGLFLAKRIIELHNGLLKIVKHNGNGSDLVIQIPCKN
ncbi:MAG: ATP-binding protein, partial [Prolixibacteraceae bacterium]|nr:ATP-binding protein [Prolixibacteraceae bacterium]